MVTLGPIAQSERSDYYLHNASTPVVINHGCGHCAIAVCVGRRNDLAEIDFCI